MDMMDKAKAGDVLKMLKEGNERFYTGKAKYPHTDSGRLGQAGEEDQGDHAWATVLTCSDSRVPAEIIFDAGIMDIFVIRVAGNVCNTDEIGSIEYGLAHVHTPVFVMLGHTQCGAVTAVSKVLQGESHRFERNIPPLIKKIYTAVERAKNIYKDVQGDEIIEYAIEENVWLGIEELFRKSPVTRELVRAEKVKVVGAIYEVGSGKVRWLEEEKVEEILERVEASNDKETEPWAENCRGYK